MAPAVLLGVLTAVLTVIGDKVFRSSDGAADVLTFTVLLVAAAASAGLRFGRKGERVSFSFTAVVFLTALPLLGPLGAVLLAIGAAVLDARQNWWQAWVFNGIMFGLATSVAALVYGAAGGAFLVDGTLRIHGVVADVSAAGLTRSVGGPLLLADAAFLFTNVVVLLIITSRDLRTTSPAVVVSGVLGTAPTFLAWAIVAFVVVALWVPGRLGPVALLLIMAPLLVTRHMHALFSAERRTRSSIIGALAGAGRDDAVKAHGERVLQYSVAIATEMGARPADRTVLQYAAWLHAVGMHEQCTQALRVGPGVTGPTAAALASHGVIGRIEFLEAAARAVRHEAERFDGTGGPDGLVGTQIPLHARILAVADAADVLVTQSDAERPDVVTMRVLRGLEGSRFDPAVVRALEKVLGGTSTPRRRTMMPVDVRHLSRSARPGHEVSHAQQAREVER